MPVLPCLYSPPPGLGNGHLQTVYPVLFRKDISLSQQRVRIAVDGDDFLDLDVSTPEKGNGRVAPSGGNGDGRKFPDRHEPSGHRVADGDPRSDDMTSGAGPAGRIAAGRSVTIRSPDDVHPAGRYTRPRHSTKLPTTRYWSAAS